MTEEEPEDGILHLESGFSIERSKKGCTLYVLLINGEKHKVAEFKTKYSALNYIRAELTEP